MSQRTALNPTHSGQASWLETQLPPEFPPQMADGAPWPKLSVVTVSYNQAPYLEDTLRSVLGQGYPNLEYIVIDGGSTDGSVEIIQRYADRLAYWVSEKDRGQYDGLNKGFAHATGEILAWINSDDLYCPWAFRTVASVLTAFPEIEWLTSNVQMGWSQSGLCAFLGHTDGYSRKTFLAGRNLRRDYYYRSVIQQESTFWRRTLWERSGARLDDTLQYAGDFELWARFWESAQLVCVNVPLGGYRYHLDQKASAHFDRYLSEAQAVLARYGSPRPPSRLALRLKRMLLHRVPSLASRLADAGWHVGINAASEKWIKYPHYIL